MAAQVEDRMSVDVAQSKIKQASKELRIRWHETKAVWRDENSRRFEAEHVSPLWPQLRTVEAALRHMRTVLAQARRDCQ